MRVAVLVSAVLFMLALLAVPHAALGAKKRGSGPKKGLAVERAKAKLAADGKKWAIVVGVNEYLDPGIPRLRFSVADARLMADTLVRKCGYDERRILLLTDDQKPAHLRPLRINLQQQIAQWLKHADKNDTVLVFFSGHGFLDERGQGFLAPQDCEKARLGLTALRTADLCDLLQQCAAQQKLLVLDCCHAGGLKSVDSPGATGEDLAVAFREAAGLITLASCGKSEQSREWEEKSQGLFTYYLVKALEGAADFDHDGVVDSDELYRYLLNEVRLTAQRELNGRQTPVRHIPPDVVGVFALARAAAGSVPSADSSDAGPVNSIGMKLVRIPAGEFEMGSTHQEIAPLLAAKPQDDFEAGRAVAIRSECPRHHVRITRAFWLGAYEVTVGQFRRFVDDTGYRTQAESSGEGSIGWDEASNKWCKENNPRLTWRTAGFPQTDDHPVVNVSWNDVVEFCRWLGRKERNNYRLPTEAEWEYACRAGTHTRFPGGEYQRSVRHYGNVDWGDPVVDGYRFTAPVGQFKANAFGMCDMHGNAWEWCADWFGEDYYQHSPVDDPQGPTSGTERIDRGGSWSDSSRFSAACASRDRFDPAARANNTGFRVVRETR